MVHRPEDPSSHWFFDAVEFEGTLSALLQEMGRTPAMVGFFFGILSALLLLSFRAVVQAQRPVGVVFAFLAYLMGIIFGLMFLSSEYIAVLHLILYPGAILLFFLFLLLTTSDQWFAPAGEKRYTFGLVPFILLWGAPLLAPLLSLGLLPPQDLLFWRGETYSLLENSTSLLALGEGVCSEYVVALSLLGLLLLLALLSAMALLNPPAPRRADS
jgi:NADH-quinone oxidoreductase subunit J